MENEEIKIQTEEVEKEVETVEVPADTEVSNEDIVEAEKVETEVEPEITN